MTMFLSHSAWGAQAPNRQSPMRGETTHLFVHHSATQKPADIEAAKAQVRAIQADHLQRTVSATNSTLWGDIAYGVLCGPGVILEGRGWDARSGATGPGNRVPHPSGSWDNISASICVLGNYKDEQLDDATRTSLVAAMAEARARYGDNLIVMGDRDVNSTNCPGDNLYPLLPELWAESGDDMALSDDDVHRIAEAVLSRPLDIEGETHPFAEWIGYLYAEVTRTEAQGSKMVKNIVDAISAHAIIVDDTPGVP